jgi:hypothetical protein
VPERAGIAPRLALTTALGYELGSVVYLLSLLAGAALDRPGRRPGNARPMRFVVLVPAHDEELTVASCIRSLHELETTAPWEAIVIADNCSDATARGASEEGATVWERLAPEDPGKGPALAWGVDRVLRERAGTDAIVMVDADCKVSPNLLDSVARRLQAGAEAVQTAYVASNPQSSTEAALRHAGFALINVVRPRGKAAFGLSCGLLGTGMAFTTDLLARERWLATGLAEDAEQHMRLVDAGVRVAFAPEAFVASPMPVDREGSAVQQARWERGALAVAKAWAPRLIWHGLREGDLNRLHAGVEALVVPHSLLAAAEAVTITAAAALGLRRLAWLGLAALLGHLLFVLGGLKLAGAPPATYRALPRGARLIPQKLLLYSKIATSRRQAAWVRTPRASGE